MDQDEERCESCRFWEEGLVSSNDLNLSTIVSKEGIGVCLRYPPAMLQGLNETSQGIRESLLFFWPRTRPGAWCGEFQPKTE